MIAVSGGSETTEETWALAEDVGAALARAGAVVVTGGLGGVMEAACKGAKSQGGTTIGILPGERTATANAYIDIPIATGMSHGRNTVIIHTCDGVIALPGAFGTLSEVALALIMGKPVVSIGSWRPDERVRAAMDAAEAVAMIMEMIDDPRG